MPELYKSRNSHDVVPICIEHHYEYEGAFADKLKLELSEKYNAPLSGDVYFDKKLRKAKGSAYALHTYGDKMPVERVLKLQTVIEDYFGIDNMEKRHLDKLLDFDANMTEIIKKHGEIVMGNITDIQEFVEMWRQHFLDSMNPKCMPEFWDVKRAAKRPE